MQSALRIAKVVTSRYQVERCTFSPDGNLLAACFSDYSIRVFSVNKAVENAESDHAHSLGKPSAVLKCRFMEHQSSVWCIDFSSDSSLLCSCSSDMTVKVWDVQAEELKLNFVLHSSTVWCCSFVPCRTNRTMIASGSGDQTVKLWNCDNGEVVHNLMGHLDAVECLSFTRSGSHLCTGARDGTIKIWSNLFLPSSPVCLLLLYSTDVWVRFCTFSWFGKDLLATGGPDNSILLWDLQDIIKQEFSPPVVNTNSVSTLDHKLVTKGCCLQSDCGSVTNTEAGSLANMPKLWLKGHLNTVWNCVFGYIQNHKHDMVLISCSGDRTLRYTMPSYRPSI